MTVKSRFKNGAFRPIEKIGRVFKEDEIVEIDIRRKKDFAWRGALKGKKETSVGLQHKIKNIW
ncbi:MAG TPA: hypothetical protein PLX02_13955 [Syntrophorhabdaceae bacterium]|nr:hypothetical protein [Syntrophorhabdaceae bacterium]HQM82713.1 hypothetical protein [Syntrophorhabdaceae bacterium]